jgi:hypothetical protein
MKWRSFSEVEERDQMEDQWDQIACMTERQWLTCENPTFVWHCLGFHRTTRRYPITHRQRRLLLCSCARTVWGVFARQCARTLVEQVEAFADGRGTWGAVSESLHQLVPARSGFDAGCVGHNGHSPVEQLAAHTASDDCWLDHRVHEALTLTGYILQATSMSGGSLVVAADPEQLDPLSRLCGLLRDIFGNPFRPVSIDPAWLQWHGGTVVRLAAAIYDERRFEDMPILADALEEAGCADGHLLDHCRLPGEHARGCWLLDHLLGKE